jgi:hypothetical protein
MINDYTYYEAIYGERYEPTGGQELILGEIIGCLNGCMTVWLPFPNCGKLASRLDEMNFLPIQVAHDAPTWPSCDALYFGSPTVKNGRTLFGDLPWTRELDIAWTLRARQWCMQQPSYRTIVSGLGIGDVTIADRIVALGPNTEMVCHKRFRSFEDWVTYTDLRR